MALSPAEKQAAYRERQRIKLEELRQQASRPHRAEQPAQPNPFADFLLTEQEVEHLRQCLEQHRAEAAKRVKRKAELDATVSKMTPEQQEHIKGLDARLAARAELKERLKPKAGTYWYVPWISVEFKPVTITVGPRGGIRAVNERGEQLSCRFDTFYSRWVINGEPIYATKEEADSSTVRGKAPSPRPYADKTIAELRALRSEHHPDKGNAHADPTIYQQAIEELDSRRK